MMMMMMMMMKLTTMKMHSLTTIPLQVSLFFTANRF